MFFYYDYYWVVLPAIILAAVAQAMVSSNFNKYSKVKNVRNITGAQAARRILDNCGLSNVRIERTNGNLTDHYDPRENVIRLSDSVFDSSSVAAVGVAAHEAGHAIQYGKGYFPIKVRNAILPVAQFSSTAAIWIILLGFVFSSVWFLVPLGIILFSATVLFQLITLPVEFNASARALSIIDSMDILSPEENIGAKKVLRAAALTYLAAALSAVLQLLRLVLIANNRSSRGRR